MPAEMNLPHEFEGTVGELSLLLSHSTWSLPQAALHLEAYSHGYAEPVQPWKPMKDLREFMKTT
jgi:hypothetical protein